jgi:hypothetical protein
MTGKPTRKERWPGEPSDGSTRHIRPEKFTTNGGCPLLWSVVVSRGRRSSVLPGQRGPATTADGRRGLPRRLSLKPIFGGGTLLRRSEIGAGELVLGARTPPPPPCLEKTNWTGLLFRPPGPEAE